MKATELLITQHDEARALFKLLMKPGGRTEKNVEKLADSLAAHMAIEQELFYPAMLAVKEDLVLEGYEEHALARFALRRLRETEISHQTFKAKVVALKEIIEHHAEEEEEDLFPKAEKALGEDRSASLRAKMVSLYRETMKEGYVRAVARGGSAVSSASAPDLHAP